MGAAVILFVFPWILDYLLLRANKQREAKLAALPADHVFPEGPVSHLDGEFSISSRRSLLGEILLLIPFHSVLFSPFPIRAITRALASAMPSRYCS